MCSRSMLVTTERIGESFRNERSLSSASATKYCDHGSCCGLAVHACHCDAIFQAHQLRQHLRTLNHGDVNVAGSEDLGIVFADGGAGYDNLGADDVLRAMPLVNGRPKLG